MIRLFITLAFLATVSECDHPTGGRSWHASDDRGDKPGIGYVLRIENGQVAGEAYIMDAAFPHDFSHGRRAAMKTVGQTPTEMTFRVRWNKDLEATLRFQFKGMDWPDSFDAVVSEMIGSDSVDAETYRFARDK
jgi:hypothetical protein